MKKKTYYIDEREEEARQRDRVLFFDGMSDFFALLLGLLAILLLGMLLFSLLSWLESDVQTFVSGFGGAK